MTFSNLIFFMACGTSNMTTPEETAGQRNDKAAPLECTTNRDGCREESKRNSSTSRGGRRKSFSTERPKASCVTKRVDASDKEVVEEEVLKEKNNGEKNGREDSILLSSRPGSPSPSFRVYCLRDNDSLNSQFHDDQDKTREKKDLTKNQEEKENRAPNGISKKGSERQGVKIWRKTREFRSVIQRGGSVGMKNFLNISGRSQNSSTSHWSPNN